MEKPISNSAKGPKSTTGKNQEPARAATPPAPVRVPPLFRKNDWLTAGLVFGVIWIIYLLTLAPELTLEDSGELCTASYYAGIPHPPGYPFWALYSWFWTWILPIGNVAWRVEVGQSLAAALGCGGATGEGVPSSVAAGRRAGRASSPGSACCSRRGSACCSRRGSARGVGGAGRVSSLESVSSTAS